MRAQFFVHLTAAVCSACLVTLLSGCVTETVSPSGSADHNQAHSRPSHDEGIAARNLKAANQWLAKNREQPGVIETASGLQYRIIEKSQSNCQPTIRAAVEVHYRMSLAETGAQIDSSYQRGKPTAFSLYKMIRGWQEGVPLMSVGDHYEFFIPPHLAYGVKGAGHTIPPNSVLRSDVYLLQASHCYNS